MGSDAVIVAVCGVKNSGKTTLLEKLVHSFSERGIQTAVIKHDGHDFFCDEEGRDSFRLKKAGACGTVVFSRERLFVHKTFLESKEKLKEERDVSWEEKMAKSLAGYFPEVQLILAEGFKNTGFLKIEVVRKEISSEAVSNPEGRFLIVTDWEKGHFSEETAGLEDIEKIVEAILSL